MSTEKQTDESKSMTWKKLHGEDGGRLAKTGLEKENWPHKCASRASLLISKEEEKTTPKS